MTLREYIEEQYPVENIISMYVNDPYKRVMEADCLPYDRICMIDGKPQKVVELTDEEYIPVIDIISWDEYDLQKCSPEIKELYKAYMDNVSVEDYNVQEILSISRNYKKNRESKLTRAE